MTVGDTVADNSLPVRITLAFGGANQTTQIAIGGGALTRVGPILRSLVDGRDAILVTDTTVEALYAPVVVNSLKDSGLSVVVHSIEPGEASKSLGAARELYEVLAANRLGRDAVVVALGGGVVSDLAGFVAATWMRGIDFAICPTTVEADVDACVGGKTAVNIAAGKNLVGSFHQPRLVVIDPLCLQSLPQRDVRAGLAESIKHALICDANFLDWHEANADAILGLDPAMTTELILRNVGIKARIVESDPTEVSGSRILLNFGHTFGHAVEALTGYTLRHGECVAIGMAAACRLSHRVGLLDASVVERVERLLQRFGLPIRLAGRVDVSTIPTAEGITAKIAHDKKARSDSARFVLLKGIGLPVVHARLPDSLIHEVCTSILGNAS